MSLPLPPPLGGGPVPGGQPPALQDVSVELRVLREGGAALGAGQGDGALLKEQVQVHSTGTNLQKILNKIWRYLTVKETK